jgi:DNA/RNA-binding domain of Phe-tRNA-synthetase-like protein
MTIIPFQYHRNILDQFPNLCGGVIIGKGICNALTPKALQQDFLDEQHRILERLGDNPLSDLPTLASWRSAFRTFGVDPTRYRSAAEALLRRLIKKGDIPSVTALVDIGNLVSIRYALPVAVIDSDSIAGGIIVHYAVGNESFNGWGEEEVSHPDPGEVIFSDSNGSVVARRWCWRQSKESTARLETRNLIVTVEAHHPHASQDIQASLYDLIFLFEKYTGGEYETHVLGKME